jgi:hypothetical protein
MGLSRVWAVGLVVSGMFLVLACSSSSQGTANQQTGSKKGESCSKSPDCADGLKCIEQECVPDLPVGFCQQYVDLCGADSEATVSECELKCFDTTSASSDDCWFRACGVAVGKCDGDEPDDVSISNCGDQHGWR